MKKPFHFVDGEWKETHFSLLKENDIFSFDKESVFTASCDAYIYEHAQNTIKWTILTKAKDMESLKNKNEQYYLK